MSCYSKDELEQMLEDVVNALDMAEGVIEEHGPLGTEPAELVRLVLDQKDRTIRNLRAGMRDCTPNATAAPAGTSETPYCARFFYGQTVKIPLEDSTYQYCTFVGTDMHGVSTVKTKGGRYKQVWDCNLYLHNAAHDGRPGETS